MLDRKVSFLGYILFEPATEKATLRNSYAIKLANCMEKAHGKLRKQQLLLRTANKQKETIIQKGQKSWLRTKQLSKRQSHQLRSQCADPYNIQETPKTTLM